ncbi:MAG: 6-phosphofructokinase [Clostridia bacterium]|nr:6-phosphofructokinase [Clostridia bacterium]
MAILKGNAIVGQSGGPTSAINATLSGVIRGASFSENISKLYGMKNGIEGFLGDEIIDLSYLFDDEDKLSLLESTPASALGSCRKKLPNLDTPSDVYSKIFDLFKKYDIRYFFYIGGNDSMDTVYKLSEYSNHIDYEIRIIGVPKTIDNDLPITDHTPGFGSAAKFIATAISEIATDCSVYTMNAVTIVEMMGRDAGWLTCAAALAKEYNGLGADLIYLPECPFYDNEFISALERELEKHPNVVVAVSEGIRYENGNYVGASNQSGMVDVFGHKYLAGTAKNLEALVKREIGCKVRSVELNLLQRCSSHILSNTDIEESVKIGASAVKLAESGKSGEMLIFVRKNTECYEVEISSVPVSMVANKVKYVPQSFINDEKNNVTKACIEYMSPLVQGERQVKYENGIPVHIRLK